MSAAAAGDDLRSLIARGDDYATRGDVRAAVSFYQTALKSVRDPRAVDPMLMADLRRAQSFIMDRAREFQEALDRAVTATPRDEAAAVRLSAVASRTKAANAPKSPYAASPEGSDPLELRDVLQ